LKKIEVTEEEYLEKVESWESLQAPFSESDINYCVTAAKTILLYREQLHKEAQKNTEKKEPFSERLTKYEPESNIKVIFSKSGKAEIYPTYLKFLVLMAVNLVIIHSCNYP